MYNKEKFVKIANKVHKNKYDYSLVDYMNSKTKVKIICPVHGVFKQTPSKHLNGRGCQKCGGSNKKNTDIFIEESTKIHKNKYDYSLVDYKDAKTKVKIICPVHGVFEQRPDHHLRGSGCIKCMINNAMLTNEDFIKKSIMKHGNRYDYSKVNYIGNNIKVIIGCKKHGYFTQKPSNHMQGQGCPVCRQENMKSTKEIFIEKSNIIHEFFYNYSLVDYINNYTKVIIICPIHGEFDQKPNNHLQGQGCSSCKKSLMENKINKFLKNQGIVVIRQKTFDDCKNINKLPFDFYLPDFNLCIEYNGKQHYEPIKWFGGEMTLKYIQKNDFIKRNFCEDRGIKYLEISYKDDDKINDILWNIISTK